METATPQNQPAIITPQPRKLLEYATLTNIQSRMVQGERLFVVYCASFCRPHCPAYVNAIEARALDLYPLFKERNVSTLKTDLDEADWRETDFPEEQKIHAVPTTILYEGEHELGSLVGFTFFKELQRKIEDAFPIRK